MPINKAKPLTKAEQKALRELFMRADDATQKSLNISTISTKDLIDRFNKDGEVTIACHAMSDAAVAHKKAIEAVMLSTPVSLVETTLAERGERYGKFSEHATIAQGLQNVMRAHRDGIGWVYMSHSQRQALTVISDKIARILNGNPDYIDNWHDIQGYAKLVEDELRCTQNT